MAAPTPLAPLPGLITQHKDYRNLLPTIEEVEGRILRLKVQALVLILTDLFDFDALTDEVHVEDQGEEEGLRFRLVTDKDEDDDTYGTNEKSAWERQRADREGKASYDTHALKLRGSVLMAFAEASPFSREELKPQLQQVYERVLTVPQRKGVAEWNHFWEAARPGT